MVRPLIPGHEHAMECLDRASELFGRHSAKRYLDQVLAKKEILRAWLNVGESCQRSLIRRVPSCQGPRSGCALTNPLDSAGSMQRFEGPPRAREGVAAASERGIDVMGIRAVQAGALTDAIDRELPEGHADLADYRRAAPFRELASELRESPAALALGRRLRLGWR
jgi:hypothetical protein